MQVRRAGGARVCRMDLEGSGVWLEAVGRNAGCKCVGPVSKKLIAWLGTRPYEEVPELLNLQQAREAQDSQLVSNFLGLLMPE